MTITQDELAELGALTMGRAPEWLAAAEKYVVATNGAPVGSAAGIDVEGALVSIVAVRLNEVAGRPGGYLRGFTVANSQAYTARFDGNDVTYTSDSDATLAEILAGLKAEIDDDGSVNVLVSTELVDLDGDGIDDAIRYESLSSTVVVTSVQAGTWTASAEPTTVTVAVWGLDDNADQGDTGAEEGWDILHETDLAAFTANRKLRLITAGLKRVYVEFTTNAAVATYNVAKCLAEEPTE